MSSRGFTLVEVLVAVVLLAVGIAGVHAAIAACTGALGRADEYEVAAGLAQQKMTEMWAGVLPLADDEGDFPEGPEGYLWRLEVADAEREGVQEVLLTITAPSSREYRVATLVLAPQETAGEVTEETGTAAAPGRAVAKRVVPR